MRIVFDGDGVLFSSDSERIFREQGLEAFSAHEQMMAEVPMKPGPLYPLFKILSFIQCAADRFGLPVPFEIYLVTARCAPADTRVIKTIEQWKGWIDGYYFMGGKPKAEIIRKLNAHVFFDDQKKNFEGVGIGTWQVLVKS